MNVLKMGQVGRERGKDPKPVGELSADSRSKFYMSEHGE